MAPEDVMNLESPKTDLTQEGQTGIDPRTQMRRMLFGHMLSQAISVAAELRVADLLADGPKGADELADRAGCHSPSLGRLLRALAAFGVVVERQDGAFELTPLGATLRSNVPGSAWAMAVMVGGEHARSWVELLHSVRTGETAFGHVYGMGVFDYAADHPRMAQIFNQAMTQGSTYTASDIVGSFDFSPYGVVVDVGGGHGQLLASILKANPAAKGVLFDLPQVVEGAGSLLDVEGVADRVELSAGSFFESVPEGGDLYTLKCIIHDWDDERSIGILGNCRRAIPETGTLLVIERMMPERVTPDPDLETTVLMDLNMLVIAGGRERTVSEYRQLFDAAGFALTGTKPTPMGMGLIRGSPA